MKGNYETLQEVLDCDPTAANVFQTVKRLDAVVIALANEKERLLEEVLKLGSICPIKYRLPDGKIVVWHCPDYLVPMKNLGQ